MQMESIKLSPKRNGKGYISSYSVSISNKEAQLCGLESRRIIKIVDVDNGQIIIKSRRFSLTEDVIEFVMQLKNAVAAETEQIDHAYYSDSRVRTMSEMLRQFADDQTGKVARPARKAFVNYLQGLSLEMITDLVLLMYLGRDYDCNMNMAPGEERFLEFYDRYGYIVYGKRKDELIDILDEKEPLTMYLKVGLKILNAPMGTSLSTITHNWNDM